tara:strand:- start:66238 stop:66609 length:372 start_codon:yes stop_codon:yes gene_type:complete
MITVIDILYVLNIMSVCKGKLAERKRADMNNNTSRGSVANKKTYQATEARQNFSEIIDEAVHNGPVYVQRRRHRVVIICEEQFDELISREAAHDAEAADAALKDYLKNGGISLKDLKDELGLT